MLHLRKGFISPPKGMVKVKFKKIHIIGSVGSGKTYLAGFLSKRLSIPFYQLDNVVWERTIGGDIRNSIEERDRLLEEIINREKWIIEGAHHEWVLKSFDSSDLIIYISASKWRRDLRGITRFIKQKLGLEKGNFKQTIKSLFQHFKWNKDYDKEKKPEIFNMLIPYMEKVMIIKSNKEVIHNIDDWLT